MGTRRPHADRSTLPASAVPREHNRCPRHSMTTLAPDRGPSDRYAAGLIDAACAASMPELGAGSWPDALYRVGERNGVGVIGLPVRALDDAQLATLRRFRFAQYLDAGYIDIDIAYEQGVAEDPRADEHLDTVYFLAYASQDGRLLGTMTLHAPIHAPADTRVGAQDRALLPVEEYFGWGVFKPLAVLPDLPLARVREFGRFVKNRHLGPLKPLGIRAAVELCLAATHTLTGALAMSVEAFVGQFEDEGARRNLEFFHTPMVVLRGGLSIVPADDLYQPGMEGRDRHPFAVLISDLTSMTGRVANIEAALEQPGDDGLLALRRLAEDPSRAISSLVPPRGVSALADTALPQLELSLADRRCARALGGRLQAFAPFARLSVTEATTLATLLERQRVRPGQVIMTRGRACNALYLIEDGQAEVRGGPSTAIGTLGAGDCCGELSLLTGCECTTDVVARSPMDMLRLTGSTYRGFLRELPDVEVGLHRLALATAAAELHDAR